jgi:transcriptional regulator with XRE-family HTH domain
MRFFLVAMISELLNIGGMMKVRDFVRLRSKKQVQIAREVGVDPSLLSKYLNGWLEVPKHHRRKLAQSLGITQKELAEGHVVPRRLGGAL